MKPGFHDVPVNRHYDYTLVSRSDRHAEITMPVRESYLQETGVVQGGIISSLADTCAVYIFFPDLDESETMTSIEFKVNFLSPALLGDGDLRSRARVIRRGRTVGVCEVEVSQGEKIVAVGLFTYMFFQKKA